MNITNMSIVEFNENISKNINDAKNGEVIYLTQRKKPVAVLLGKQDFDIVMSKMVEILEEDNDIKN